MNSVSLLINPIFLPLPAFFSFSRLVDPNHKHVFDRIFETLETGLSKLGDTSGARTMAISGLLHLISVSSKLYATSNLLCLTRCSYRRRVE